ncbi:V-type ATP synthase subunit I [Thermococcus sp. M36]|uniref:V-type ATP synthase subunit I n=1 Tax=Thermococcus sp. M36 TaxID=1638261 RepID=UPI00143A8D6D|nr:V-type ATP synthase subunit I [Thermococcus sp. M36]NJE05597.1 V-type ATP synthase subunit I [Thermococcus sp. M36]
MFRPEEMVKVEVITLNRYKDSLLTYLHEHGAVEIREIDVDVAQKDSPNEYHRKAASYSITISRLVDFLKAYRKTSGGGIKGFIFPKEKAKKKYRYEGIEKLIKDVEAFLAQVEPEIKAVEGKITTTQAEIERIKQDIAVLELLSSIDLDVSYLRPTDMLEIVVGTVDRNKFGPLVEEVRRITEGRIVVVSREFKDKVLAVFAFLRRDYDKVNPVLAKYSLERVEIPEGAGTPRELIAEYEERLRRKEEELENARKDAQMLAEKYYDDVVFYRELMENERDKASVLPMLARTNMTFALTGWLPRSSVQDVLSGLRKITGGTVYINIREPAEEELDEVPIKLRNPAWARPFEMLTEMYGMPKYNEVDPTPIITFTYSFFFGFMLTDFMYGLIIGIIAALLVKGHRKFNDGTYKFAYTLLWSAVFTMLMGIVFGSYFGNALDMAGFTVPRVWDTFTDALVVLQLALAIGLAHLFTGYTVGFIVRFKNGDRIGAVTEQLSWMLVIVGVTMLALSLSNPALGIPGKVLFGLGFVLFMVSEFMSDLPLPMKLLMTISDFFGFVGSWLSYARLMALALATAGIAMVINILTQMIWGISIGPVPIGIVIGLILFIGGQLFSVAINALGAFVHSLRLQYVEFFGTFYSGEGKPFEPFRAKREVSELEFEA